MNYLDDGFLLGGGAGEELYNKHAAHCPVVDYHNHLQVKDLCENRHYPDIGTLWVCTDPYKHRAMRIMGVDENLISGKAAPEEKFIAWCGVLPHLVCNPLYHWSCLEMKRFFGIDEIPGPGNAREIWEECNRLLQSDAYSINGLLSKVGVKRVSTSDDLLDDVSRHSQAVSKSGIDITPSLRADSLIGFSSSWIERLAPEDSSLEAFLNAVSRRMDIFGEHGCRLADISLDNGLVYKRIDSGIAAMLFGKLDYLGEDEVSCLRSWMIGWIGRECARRQWVLQLHLGAERYTSTRLRQSVGSAGGYAAPGSGFSIRTLCDYLDDLDRDNSLPKVILYNLNPSDNAAIASLTGSFSESGQQKIKYGPAWWYNDHIYGIMDNLEVLSNYSVLSQSVGMTTDSRNVLSFSRHEYFRRILCGWLGEKVEKGLLPHDMDGLGIVVENICHRNANTWIYGKQK